MKQIPALDNRFEDNDIDHPSVVHGYRKSRGLNLDLLILHEFGLYRSEVPAIIETLRRHGIEQVAMTHASSATVGIMWDFVQSGATFEMELIDTGDKDTFYSSKFVPGFIITLN